MVLIPTKKGLVRFETSNGVLIVHTENDKLFEGQKSVTLTRQSEIDLIDKKIILPKGKIGWLFDNKVFFQIGLKYFGINKQDIGNDVDNIFVIC